MKVLVLGGTGAMGSALVEILARRGDEVIVTSRRKRESTRSVKYVQGNAHDIAFLEELLKQGFDAVVDFMVYETEELAERLDPLLQSTDQYIFLSSSRVYADGCGSITEETPRLLDVSLDKEFLATDVYPLAKAREENLLMRSRCANWTIIRPYITYNVERLQLGILEKEGWLWRALHGRPIVFTGDISDRLTTLTWGMDVAEVIAGLTGNEGARREVFHITCGQPIRWDEVLDLYCRVLEEEVGRRPRVLLIEDSEELRTVSGNRWAIDYDRLYDRTFDNSKVLATAGGHDFTPPLEGLEKCLREFLRGDKEFRQIDQRYEAWADMVAGEVTPLGQFPTARKRLSYYLYRHCGPQWRRHGVDVRQIRADDSRKQWH